MKGAGLTEEDMNEMNPVTMIVALLMAGVIAWATSRYAGHTEPGMNQFVMECFTDLCQRSCM